MQSDSEFRHCRPCGPILTIYVGFDLKVGYICALCSTFYRTEAHQCKQNIFQLEDQKLKDLSVDNDQLGLGFNKGQREPTLEVVQGRVELCLPFLTHLCLPQCMTEEFKSSLLHLPASFCFGNTYPEIVGGENTLKLS